MGLSPGCQAATAPNSTPYQSMLKRPSPSSFQTVLIAPVDPSRWPSRIKPWMFQSAVFATGIDLVPVGVAGSHPGLDARLGKGLDHLVEAGGAPVVPGHGDHVLGQAGHRGRIGAADVAPEQQAAVQGRKLIVNLLEESDVNRPVALRLHLFAGCAPRPGPRSRRRRCG